MQKQLNRYQSQQWISGRRSIRRYKPDPVPAELLEELLIAAGWAPSAHNRQPWRFGIVNSEKTKHRLASAMGQKLGQDLAKDGMHQEFIQRDVSRSYERITGAPLLVLVCLSMDDMDQYPDGQRSQNEWIMAVQSTAMAGQNFQLAAHAAGLGSCWMCAPLFCPEIVRKTLQLPNDWLPQGLITVGYPAEIKQKERQPIKNFVRFLDR